MLTNTKAIFDNSVFRIVSEYGYDGAVGVLGENPKTKKLWDVADLREYVVTLRSKNDPEFFDNECLRIQTKAGELVPLLDNPVQRKIQAEIDRQKLAKRPIRIKIPKARRHGVSTKVQADFFGDALFTKNIQFLTVCHDMESAKNMRAMFERYHKFYPFRKPKLKKITDKMWKIPSNEVSYLIDTADELDTGRSFTFHRLHLSEVAFYRDPEILMTGLLRSVDYNPNTVIIAESTANGWGGWWYEFVTQKNDYTLMFFPWFDDPGNSKPLTDKERLEIDRTLSLEEKALIDTHSLTLGQIYWRRFEIKNGFLGDEEQFRQEYPATLEESFLTSGRYYFAITEIRKNLIRSEKQSFRQGSLEWGEYGETVNFVDDESGLWKLLKEPVKGWEFRYVTGTDSAEGKAVDESNKDPDFTVITVFDRKSEEDVARFCGRVDEDVAADEIYKASVYFASACECVERSSSGIAILNILKQKDNINLYVRELQAKTEDGETVEYGFQTNKSTRDTLLSYLKTNIRLGHYKSNDVDFWKECLTFVVDEAGVPRGQHGTHDDRVLSAALAIQASLQAAETTPIVPAQEREVVEPDVDMPRKHDAYVPYVEF